jgi:hypothetical protein
MKTIFYIIFPIVAFLLILTNALYGHLLFTSNTEHVTNRYSIYIHLQPEWNSGPKNIIFDITNSWYKLSHNDTQSIGKDYLDSYNSNQIQFINNKSYVELKHDFSNCHEDWQPVLYRKAIEVIRHKIEYLQGNQLSADPDVSVYPDIENTAYNNSIQQTKVENGFVQFIPICTSKDITSYDYSIKTDNTNLGFNVYFVSSNLEQNKLDYLNFNHYEKSQCVSYNKKSFSGTCSNITKTGGLIVILPDELNQSTTKVTVNLYEKN